MKKGLIFLLGIISFLGINTVSADEIKFEFDDSYYNISSFISDIGYDTLNTYINNLLNYYYENYSNTHEFYFISISDRPSTNVIFITLTCLDKLDYTYSYVFSQMIQSLYMPPYSFSNSVVQLDIYYDVSNDVFSEIHVSETSYSPYEIFYIYSDGAYYNPYHYYYSNFNFYYYGTLFTEENDDLTYLNPDDILNFPTVEDPTLYSIHKANTNFFIDPMYLHDGNVSLEDSRYVTIDLNQYSYVILSLKDYSPRDTYTVTAYVKGQLCPTTVYNYGLEEKKDYISGYQTQPCGYYYNDFTSFLLYIKSEDIENHAIYYLTGYDSSKPNLVKVDNSVFDITYITSENENEPYVFIEGKNYPSLPYSSLTDTAALTEKNGISDTWTCAKYDTNCFLNSSGIDFSDLFDKPLELLKSIWSSITSIFSLITEFISLLPETMQSFLYLSFMVAIILGLLKIIL